MRIAETGATGAVADLGELLSLCAQGRADGLDGDGAAWAATAALLDRGGLDDARRALRLERDPAPLEHLARATVGDGRVDEALAAHSAPAEIGSRAMTAAFWVLADAAEEGRNVVLSMLVVGLVFIAVIVLGDLNHHALGEAQAREAQPAAVAAGNGADRRRVLNER